MLTGTIVNYYTHCKRQCWLFYNRINMEDNSEDVRVGRILHELNTDKKTELSIESIKVDKITKEYVTEIKKSDADINAALDQLRFYLMILQSKGIMRKGKLECIEKNKQDRKIYYIDINENEKEMLLKKYREIEAFLEEVVPPDAVFKPKCKRCSYHDYCFI
jgi:CRISPR-associated exonuclease Cas4